MDDSLDRTYCSWRLTAIHGSIHCSIHSASVPPPNHFRRSISEKHAAYLGTAQHPQTFMLEGLEMNIFNA